MRYVALEVPLRPLAIVWRRQRRHTTYAGIESLGDPLDGATLACGIAPLEKNYDLVLGLDHPILEFDELPLKPKELMEVGEATLSLFVAAQELAIRGEAKEIGIVPFHLQFLIEIVDEITLDAPRK